jgi:hypothetical protein
LEQDRKKEQLMDNVNINPLYIILLYILRCLVPLGIMLGLSYLLHRLGLIKSPPRPPQNWNDSGQTGEISKGNFTHG